MTSGGNTKSRLCSYAAVALFVVAIASSVIGGEAARAVAMVTLTLGLICTLGVFTMRLPRNADAEADEMLRDIK